jgi:hypothetical protein
LGQIRTERPFAVDVLSGVQRRDDDLLVRRYFHDDGDEVDVRFPHHHVVIVK